MTGRIDLVETGRIRVLLVLTGQSTYTFLLFFLNPLCHDGRHFVLVCSLINLIFWEDAVSRPKHQGLSMFCCGWTAVTIRPTPLVALDIHAMSSIHNAEYAQIIGR